MKHLILVLFLGSISLAHAEPEDSPRAESPARTDWDDALRQARDLPPNTSRRLDSGEVVEMSTENVVTAPAN